MDIINTRDTVEVNRALEKYENLRVISRDRGISYQSIEGDYIHIADRFHLIMNLSDKIAAEIKKTIPHKIPVGFEEVRSKFAEPNELSNSSNYAALSVATAKKIDLIKQVKKLKSQGYSQKDVSEAMKIDPKTVSRYLSMKDIMLGAQYPSRKRDSYLEPNKELIMKIYLEKKYVVEILEELKKRGIYAKSSALRDFISKKLSEKDYAKIRAIYIDRRDIINYIFSWSHRPIALDHIKDIFEKHKVLSEYKRFYEYFKSCLVRLKRDDFIEILEKEYSCKLIDRFIYNLKKDYNAVINAVTYKLNNGLLEGHVNKLKKIKRDMYGRASVDLLRKKVIYQSIFKL
ncbi:transposase [Andreesenia angusta]|uniref:transposase n=1 Tax=Andreesenia angusta TaxID=39480 RepID=UPI0008DAC7B9|nr:transposase [Andreesenia angusta]